MLILALAWAGPARAHELRRPRNYRKTFKTKPAQPAQPAKPAGPDFGPGWSPETRRVLDRLVEVRGSSAPAYNAQVPPVAAIGYDKLGADGDAAEAVFFRLVTEVEFKFSNDFWKQVPIAYGRQRLRADYESFSPLPKKLWPLQPEYRDFRKGFLKSYQDICSLVGVRECRTYLASLLIGFKYDEARAYAADALAAEAKEKPRVELIGDSDVDKEPVRWRRGFAPRPQMAKLIAALRANGFDVWAIGLDAQPILEAAATQSGIDASRCLGIDQHTQREQFTGQLKEPVPIREGAVDDLVNSTERRPALAIASWVPFADLLLYSDGAAVRVGDDAELKKRVPEAVAQPWFRRF